ncbi:MAG: DUF4011 domain-containing protein, partial [Cytophagales bacterium]|nr:DUF4011 domain-containing protein [Cytophagales bacterium]
MQAIREAILRQLEENRRELLDLSNRNRLISMPIGSKTARIVQIFDEKADETVKKLIREKKSFTFLPGRLAKRADAPADGTPEPQPEDDEPMVELPLPEDDEVDTLTGLARRHSDSRLQTRLSPEALQRKLFDLYNESRTLIEEQGVNILYLAIGFVKWIDRTNANTPRVAPLLLIPVDLVRKSAAERFAIRWREEDLQENLSLAEKFRVEFGLSLPALSLDDPESFDVLAYFRKVQEAVSSMSGWVVEADGMCLGFFSFAKFLMYRDLDAASWPAEKSLHNHPLIGRLLLTHGADNGVPEHPMPPIAVDKLDETIPAARLDHVVDADSSQTVAIELVRSGHNLVIQGPPGTGKSQTITNIIATAVLDGKKVLFVAEKLAALEVVKRRLEKEQLGVLCLELHSNKMRKADIAANLKATWDLGKPAQHGLHELNDELEKQRYVLNGHPKRIHQPLEPVRQSAFDLIGILSRDGRPEGKELSIRFTGGESWNEAQLNGYRDQLKNLALRLEAVGAIESHPWRGVRQQRYYGTERQLLLEKLTAWRGHTEGLKLTAAAVGSLLGLGDEDASIAAVRRRNRLAHWASLHPAEKLPSVGQAIWEEAGTTVLNAARNKGTYEKAVSELKGKVVSSVWKGNLDNVRRQLLLHGTKWYKFIIGSYRKAMAQLQAELTVPLPKSYAERLALVDRIREGQEAYAYLQAK